nr:MAG TPA: hypothetical protein [Caudoviricetes sp.]
MLIFYYIVSLKSTKSGQKSKVPTISTPRALSVFCASWLNRTIPETCRFPRPSASRQSEMTLSASAPSRPSHSPSQAIPLPSVPAPPFMPPPIRLFSILH